MSKSGMNIINEIYGDLDNSKELSIIGMLWNDSGIKQFWMTNDGVTHAHPVVQNLVVSGSGQDEFIDFVDNFDFAVTSGAPNDLEIALGFTIGNTTNLLKFEVATSKPLHDFFGAGYEIIHPLGDHFEKFSDLTYVFWKIEVDSDLNVLNVAPHLAMKYSYFDDDLLIRSIALSGNNLLNCDYHLINPIYTKQGNSNIPDFSKGSFNSTYISSLFELCFQDQNQWFAQVGRYSGDNLPIHFSEDETGVTGIDINMNFVKSMINKNLPRMN